MCSVNTASYQWGRLMTLGLVDTHRRIHHYLQQTVDNILMQIVTVKEGDEPKPMDPIFTHAAEARAAKRFQNR